MIAYVSRRLVGGASARGACAGARSDSASQSRTARVRTRDLRYERHSRPFIYLLVTWQLFDFTVVIIFILRIFNRVKSKNLLYLLVLNRK